MIYGGKIKEPRFCRIILRLICQHPVYLVLSVVIVESIRFFLSVKRTKLKTKFNPYSMSPDVQRKKLVSVGNYIFTGNTLGKGNFARVEEAVHTILNVKVAIKIIDVNHIKEEYVIKNLYREAKIMSKLNHPCIAFLYQTMQRSDNVYYLITEVASGGDLCAFVKRHVHGKLPEKQTKIYARQFSSAFSHMHNLKIVHRDLKMENVMLNSRQTQIKIVDFGLSNFWSPDNPLRTHCGSPEYAAPELFITGKKYGPEVDLWSFGIILYGMVLGQLPFVTSRSTQLPSQERRKQLVEQINKGLSTSHRRALSSFTTEFRSLMSRLLVADITRRITTKELAVHPWITDRGKKIIVANPLKNLDSYEKSKIVSKINTSLQMEPKVLSSTLVQEPLGRIAGMFNILKRRYQLSQVHGDGTSQTMSSLNIFELKNLSKSLEKKSSSSTREHKLKMLQTAFQKSQTTQTQTKKPDYRSPRVSLSEGKPSKPTNPIIEQEKIKSAKIKKYSKIRPNTVQEIIKQEHELEKIEESIRPSTVQPLSQTKSSPVDYREIKSPCLRRKVYSATITQHINSPKQNKSPTNLKQKDIPLVPTKASEKLDVPFGIKLPKLILHNSKPNKKQIPLLPKKSKNLKPKEKEYTAKIELKRSSDLKASKKLLEISHSTESPHYSKKEVSLRPPDANPENTNSKSEHRTRRPPTTAPLHEILETSLRTAGIVTSNSKSIRKHSGSTNINVGSKERKEEPVDRSNMAYGDYVSRASTTPAGHNKKLAIYDPIAKSIADYVSNNVSNKIYHYPWLKK
ncbi:serine/threonine-protein kinase MARK2-like [Diorhabda carinulata]|uniref:serine/threonine-protein kinase MARK2-like n=1 Tax=Diorhabda carinulata TaxID=1163345 RepID=UPI0025A15B02|nr:serine/threonine-protein kinase MARK2-like [Diorhabda carinulata]